ncbi:hypothetical protein KKG77_03810 [bacterium]|nr:hypothetical protein [bacterium]
MLFFFGISNIYANDFREVKQISLKKDELTKILVKYGQTEKLFKFRWTLYVNKGLVIHRSYDRIVGQNILNLNHKNQSFRVELKPRGSDNYNVPYILVKFKEFKYDTKEAVFDLLLSDEKLQIELKYLNNV